MLRGQIVINQLGRIFDYMKERNAWKKSLKKIGKTVGTSKR